MARARPRGMKAFTTIWAGQVVSLIGSAMTAFGIGVWAWRVTGSATALSIVAFFSFTPTIVMSPIAGALVDRWNRKWTMAISDVASGMGTVIMLILYATGHLQIWHLCIVGALSGTFQAFQWPAYEAAISTMMPRASFGRAAGMMSLAQSGSGIIAPVVAGAVVVAWGLTPIFVFDIISFCVAITLLFIVDVPSPAKSLEGRESQGNLWKETVFGWRYIVARQPLFLLLSSFFASNLIASVCMTLWTPMILARTGDSAATLGIINTVAAMGGVAGGALMTAWGGPHRKIRGVLWGMVSVALLGIMLMGLGRTLPIWLISGFLGSLIIPILNGSNDAIWQAKVPHDIQGKVFGTRLMVAQISVPVAMLAAGPLADRVFEPRMMPGGVLAGVFGSIVGVGRGAGMALIFVIFGGIALLVGIASFMVRRIRDIEDLIPDYVPVEEASMTDISAAFEANADN